MAPPPQRWLQFVGVFPALPAGADPARPRSELGAALANDSSRHVLPDDIHAHLRLQRMDPSPAFHAGTGFQSSATHKLPGNFPQLPTRLVASAATTTRMHLPELACRHRF